VTPAQLIPYALVVSSFTLSGLALGQAAPADAEPAAAAPAAPPVPAPPAAESQPAELPPPPPPKAAGPAGPPQQGKVVISAPPVPAPVARRGYHVHDGFYLRLAAGLGGGKTSLSTDSSGYPNHGVGGVGLAGDIWIGGTPWSGIAVGGLLGLQRMRDSELRIEGDNTGEGMTAQLWSLGVFIDAFPDARRGLHFGGALYLAGINTNGDSHELEELNVKNYSGGGLGLSAWVGYMGWVGPEWSLGGLLKLSGAATRKEEDDLTREASAFALSLSLSALYH
jgi:hypothetical protein